MKIEEKSEPMEINMTVAERLWLNGLLPKEGNIGTVRTSRDIQNVITISQEEQKSIGFQVVGAGKMQWNPQSEEVKTFRFTRFQMKLITDTMVRASTSEKLNIECISLYEKFVEPKPNVPLPDSETGGKQSELVQ